MHIHFLKQLGYLTRVHFQSFHIHAITNYITRETFMPISTDQIINFLGGLMFLYDMAVTL